MSSAPIGETGGRSGRTDRRTRRREISLRGPNDIVFDGEGGPSARMTAFLDEVLLPEGKEVEKGI